MQSANSPTFKDRAENAMGITKEDARLTKSYIFVAFTALLLGGMLGLLQGLNRAGLLELPT